MCAIDQLMPYMVYFTSESLCRNISSRALYFNYLFVNMFPSFDDFVDIKVMGKMSRNYGSMMLAALSIFLSELSVAQIQAVMFMSTSGLSSATSSFLLRHHWNFANSTWNADQQFYRDIGASTATETVGFVQKPFAVAAFLGLGDVVTSPPLISDSALPSDFASMNMKTRGWVAVGKNAKVSPPARESVLAGAWNGNILLYGGCIGLKCFNDLWLLNTLSESWSSIPIVPSNALAATFPDSLPAFRGASMQIVSGSAYISCGAYQSDVPWHLAGRLTVARMAVSSYKAVMDVFVFSQYSAVLECSTTNNQTHIFIVGGTNGASKEQAVLVLTVASMSITSMAASPLLPSPTLFHQVNCAHFNAFLQIRCDNNILLSLQLPCQASLSEFFLNLRLQAMSSSTAAPS